MYGLFAQVSFGARLDPSSSIHSEVICDIVSLSFNDGCGEGGRSSGDFPGSVALYSMIGGVEGSWTGWCCLCSVLECSALCLASSLVWRCFMRNALGLDALSVVFPGLRVVLWDNFGCLPALYVEFVVV